MPWLALFLSTFICFYVCLKVRAQVSVLPQCPDSEELAIHEFQKAVDFEHFDASFWAETTIPEVIDSSQLTKSSVDIVSCTANERIRTGAVWDKTYLNNVTNFLVAIAVKIPDGADAAGLSFNILRDADVAVHTTASGWNYYGISSLDAYVGLRIVVWSSTTESTGNITISYSAGGTPVVLKQTYLQNNFLRMTDGIRYRFVILDGYLFSMEACEDNGLENNCRVIADNLYIAPAIADLIKTGNMKVGVGSFIDCSINKALTAIELNAIRFYKCADSMLTTTPISTPSGTTQTNVITSKANASQTSKTTITMSTTARASNAVTVPSSRSVTATTTIKTSTSKGTTTSSSTTAKTTKKTTTTQRPATPTAMSIVGTPNVAVPMRKVIALEISPNQLTQKSFFLDSKSEQMTENSGEGVKTAETILTTCKDFSPNRIAPVTTAPPFKVTPTFAVDTFKSISTVDQTITVSAMFLLSWTVNTCPITGSAIRVEPEPESISVGSIADIWTPSYRFLQSSTANIYMKQSDDFGEDIIATVSGDIDQSPNMTLTFYWLKDGQYSAACSLDLTQFPFDEQTCLFSFSLMRSIPLIEFESPTFIWPEKQDDEWHFLGHATLENKLFYKGLPTSSVHFSVTLKRNPVYYIVNVILPILLVVLVALGSFALSPHDVTRPSLVVYCVLALTVSQASINNLIPKTSHRVLLSDYVSGILWLTAICFLYQIAICWFATREQNQQANKKNPEKFNHSKPNCLMRFGVARIADLFFFTAALGAFIGFNVYAIGVINT